MSQTPEDHASGHCDGEIAKRLDELQPIESQPRAKQRNADADAIVRSAMSIRLDGINARVRLGQSH